mmetsp:Transcript_15042/g.17027  ORF Transcript_15042/g.17027 Transcript_15042/m.17027 type:complete len:268 (+) Transcript_15042:195-998(+)
MGFSTWYLNLLHSVVFLIGATVTALAVSLLVEGDERLPENYGPSTWYAWLPLIFGVCLLVSSVLGCCCTKEGNVCFLTVYGLLQFVSGVFILVGGSVIIVTIDRYMANIVESHKVSNGLEPGIGGAQQDFADFMLGLCDGCCASITIPACSSNSTFNNADGRTYCYLSSDPFQAGFEAVDDSTYCESVGLPQACADGDAHEFLQINYDFLDQNVLPAGIALTVFGALLFVASFCSCHLGCKRERRPKEYAQTAEQLNYGGDRGLMIA